jgi:hypothetical protein
MPSQGHLDGYLRIGPGHARAASLKAPDAYRMFQAGEDGAVKVVLRR